MKIPRPYKLTVNIGRFAVVMDYRLFVYDNCVFRIRYSFLNKWANCALIPDELHIVGKNSTVSFIKRASETVKLPTQSEPIRVISYEPENGSARNPQGVIYLAALLDDSADEHPALNPVYGVKGAMPPGMAAM